MKPLFYKIFVIIFFSSINTCTAQHIIAQGQQPQLSVDNAGVIRMVYGEDDKIYYASSSDNGQTFGNSQLVATIKDMHLGMSRGPQLASSANYSMVTAIDKKGTVHSFRLSHATGRWSVCADANDVAGSAPEGLMSIAADKHDHFYLVWLDIRNDKRNKICFAKTTSHTKSWGKNTVAYISPDKTVCECCKPGIAVNGTGVYIQFRNWLNGSRDLYLLSSSDEGSTFTMPVKLGTGTWRLNGCPMDGGGLVVNEKMEVTSVWRRQDKIYLSTPNQPEIEFATGRNCSIANPQQPLIVWQEGEKLKIADGINGNKRDVGNGAFIKAVRTKDNKILCVWETGGKIAFTKM